MSVIQSYQGFLPVVYLAHQQKTKGPSITIARTARKVILHMTDNVIMTSWSFAILVIITEEEKIAGLLAALSIVMDAAKNC